MTESLIICYVPLLSDSPSLTFDIVNLLKLLLVVMLFEDYCHMYIELQNMALKGCFITPTNPKCGPTPGPSPTEGKGSSGVDPGVVGLVLIVL